MINLTKKTTYTKKINDKLYDLFISNVYPESYINKKLPNCFYDIKLSNYYGLWNLLDSDEKEKMLSNEYFGNVILSCFKKEITEEEKANNIEKILRKDSLTKKELLLLVKSYNNNSEISKDIYIHKNLVRYNIISKSCNKKDLIEKYSIIFNNKQEIKLEQMEEAYNIIIELIKNNFEYNYDELLTILVPVLNNVPITFLQLLIKFSIEEYDASKISELWSSLSLNNLSLLELRDSIIENSKNQKFFTSINGLPNNIPFYNSDLNETADSTEIFLKSIDSTNLSYNAIDFLVSLSEWLYKYNWMDYEELVKPILINNRISKNYFNNEFYDFYIERILQG